MWNGINVKIPGGPTSESDANRLLERALEQAPHKVEDYVSPKVAREIAHQAVALRTKESSVLAALIASVSSILAGKAVLNTRPESNYSFIPGLNILSVAYPGSGKTQGMGTFCVELLSKIEALLNRSILGFPANFAALREFLADNNGIGTIATDEMGRFLMKETGNSLASDMIPVLNLLYSGSAIKQKFRKARSIDVESSCATICGTVHAAWAVNLLHAWSGGDGFVDRWLFTASDNDIADAQECDEANQATATREDAIDIYGMCMMLAVQMHTNANKVEYYLSEEARNCFYDFSKQTKKKKSDTRQDFRANKTSSMESLDSKVEENVNRVAMVLHVLDHELCSYAETGQLDIPLEVSAETWRRALLYVTTSVRVAEILLERSHEYDVERAFVLLASSFLFPRLIGEVYSYRNVPTFGEKEGFQKCARKLESLGLGKTLEVSVPKTVRNPDAGKSPGNTLYTVFFKAPPSILCEDKLRLIGLTKTEYASSYNALPRIGQKRRSVLREALQFISTQNPYATENDRELVESISEVGSVANTPFIQSYSAQPEHSQAWSPVDRRDGQFSDEDDLDSVRSGMTTKRQRVEGFEISDDELV